MTKIAFFNNKPLKETVNLQIAMFLLASYALYRTVNSVGDRSTPLLLLAITLCTPTLSLKRGSSQVTLAGAAPLLTTVKLDGQNSETGGLRSEINQKKTIHWCVF